MARIPKWRRAKMVQDRLAEFKAKNRKSEVPNLELDRKIDEAAGIVERLSNRPQSKQLVELEDGG